MSYKNDHMLVIANKFGKASGDAKAELFETYDRLRDLTVSGPSIGGSSFGSAASFLMNVAKLVAPSAYMPMFSQAHMNIPGTSYSSPLSGGNSIVPGGTSSFGIGSLGNYPGFTSGGAAPVFTGIGNALVPLASDFTVGGMQTTGYAASMVNWAPSAASAAAGTYSGFGGFGSDFILPTAGIVSGLGGVLAAMGPYLGPAGLGATIAGNLAQGYGGAALAAYQNVSGRILNNADTILSNKVKNIETVVKMLNTQGDVVRKMLKEGIEGDQKQIQNL